jgi:CubicO group peptidase (beta-lactamase class C family)
MLSLALVMALSAASPDTPYNAACKAALAGRANDAFAALEKALASGDVSLRLLEQDTDLVTLRKDPRWPGLVQRVRSAAEKTVKSKNVGGGLVASTPEAEGLDPAALAALVKGAEAAHSTGLVVLRNGKRVGEWTFGAPSERTEAMSATKSIVSLAIGMLIDEQKIPSLDTPVHTWFPEWRQGRKEQITLRHLLSHTSGLQANPTTEEIYRSPDFVRLALAAELSEDPGTRFFYNNKAANLLAGIVEKASGQRLDRYLQAKLFAPLGIKDFSWTLDAAGNPHAMSGLQLHPIDLAKIGQMILDGGVWHGQRVVGEAWLKQSTLEAGQAFVPSCGLLWWRNFSAWQLLFEKGAASRLKERGADQRFIELVKELEGQKLSRDQLAAVVEQRLGADGMRELEGVLVKADLRPRQTPEGEPFGFNANGYLGQYLFVMPRAKLVVVRMVQPREGVAEEVIGFPEFFRLARKLGE